MVTKFNIKKDKGYHIRDFDINARRLAKAGASVAGIGIGPWIAKAIVEKFNRDILNHPPEVK